MYETKRGLSFRVLGGPIIFTNTHHIIFNNNYIMKFEYLHVQKDLDKTVIRK